MDRGSKQVCNVPECCPDKTELLQHKTMWDGDHRTGQTCGVVCTHCTELLSCSTLRLLLRRVTQIALTAQQHETA